MDTPATTFSTLADVIAWCRAAPAGTRLDAHAVADLLAPVAELEAEEAGEDAGPRATEAKDWTWRERLWVVPAETRLGVPEVAEALGRPKSFVYARTQRHTGKGAKRRPLPLDDRLPHRKLDGCLVFTAGELRAWIGETEEAVVRGPTASTEGRRAGPLRAM